MHEHEPAVPGAANIDLEVVGAQADAVAAGLQGIFRGVGGATPVGDT
ncbi:MAG: hypothetical protein KF760_29380 [Candidatus Eremiobacteraeota bacterium]|nr:hypothetical protein [Candidatus Eremiobacteraeota bacterium]MCW5865913.1 hypothetical protein [Candidatus Eremiobacteraeota bacterium]